MLEWQLARFGPTYAPAHLILEIEDTRAEIAKTKEQLKQLWTPDLSIKGIGILTATQIDTLRQTLADMFGIAIDDIDIFSADEGSVIVTLLLPLDAAAHLLALHRAGHPWITRAHIIGVELDPREASKNIVRVKELAAAEQERLRLADPTEDHQTWLLLEALPLVGDKDRRNALITRFDERLAEQRTTSAQLPDPWHPTPASDSPDERQKIIQNLDLPDDRVFLHVTFSDAVRQAA